MKLTRWMILCMVLAGCISVDQASKHVARARLAGEEMRSFFLDTFRLDYSENHGAFLGLGAGWPEHWRTALFTAVVLVLLTAFLIYLLKTPLLGGTSFVCGAFVIAGGFSNLIDRIFNDGAVIDFLNVGIGPVRTGIFNVADMAILFGSVIFVFTSGAAVEPKEGRTRVKPG
ncbi:MAG: signal peptidase II [Candidatus Omnitrophota bacterium]